jgi:hypothetical protein
MESRVNLVKSSVTCIFSLGPKRAHLITNCDAISCISSYMARIEIGPNAAHISKTSEWADLQRTRHQYTVGNFPVVLPWVGCEEAIIDPVSNLREASRHQFRESLLITDLVHQGVGCDEDPLDTTEGKFEDWPFILK